MAIASGLDTGIGFDIRKSVDFSALIRYAQGLQEWLDELAARPEKPAYCQTDVTTLMAERIRDPEAALTARAELLAADAIILEYLTAIDLVLGSLVRTATADGVMTEVEARQEITQLFIAVYASFR